VPSDDDYIGSIEMTAYPWPNRLCALCDGAVLPWQQNTALASLIGTVYGGNGFSTLALPDLRGRMPMGTGQGNGLTVREPGQMAGEEQVTLLPGNMPEHSHPVSLGGTGSGGAYAVGQGASAGLTTPAQTGPAGGAVPVPIMPPVLAVTFQIALEGIYPARA